MNETSWEENPQQEQQEQPQSGQELNQDPTMEAFDNIELLNKLDRDFEKVYSDVVKNDNEELEIFSSKIQKLELGKFASHISKKTSIKDEEEYHEEIQDLLNTQDNDILKIFDNNNIQNNRKKLYEMYSEISNINPIAFRMLQVYINNILVKNMQTKQFINIIENDINPKVKNLQIEHKDKIEKFLKTIILYFDLQSKLKNKIVPDTLKFGDFYVELVDLSKVDNILKQHPQVLQENIENLSGPKSRKSLCKYAIFEDWSSVSEKGTIEEIKAMKPIQETSTFDQKMNKILRSKKATCIIEEADINFWNDVNDDGDEFDVEDFQKLDFNCMEDFYLRLLSPMNILKIEKDGNIFGYLVIEDIDGETGADNEINMYSRFLNDGANSSSSSSNNDQETILVDTMINGISNKISELMVQDDGILSDIPEDLLQSLRVIAYEKIRKRSKIKFRFVQEDSLINFHTSIDKFSPYGTSIFDPIILPVKMYTIALMSSVISRLSRASVIRKWNVEVGSKRNYPAIIEKVKKDLRSKSISYDNLNSIKNISQVMTDFRDIAVISQNGQKFIDMEIMPMQDRALPLNDLQDLRNELISSTGIPAVYLNIGDTIELRESLVNLNISFAQNINTYQSYFEDSINKLINGIFDLILKKNNYDSNFKLSQYFKISMSPPIVLQLQNNEAVISTIANITGLLQQAQVSIDPLELFKIYAPDIDWDKLSKTGEQSVKKMVKDELIKGTGAQPGQQF